MSWPVFYLIASGLITFLVLLVALPFLKRRSGADKDSLSNAQIVRQRLQELEREAAEGVISPNDKRQAIDELKLSLVDETAPQSEHISSAKPALFAGGLLALAIAGVVYWQANQLGVVKRASNAAASLPELSRKLAEQDASAFTADDVADLALAIRQRLRVDEDDVRGWMFLGRLWMSTGQDAQAIDALEKAVAIEPQNTDARVALAQALLAGSEEAKLKRAQKLLRELLRELPQNNNLALLMAVASAQLGDLADTQRYFDQVKPVLAEQSPIYQRLESRITELEQRHQQAGEVAATPTGFNIKISVAEALTQQLPDEGYLIVFAQDANSENRMPAAVIKMPLQNFPVEVTLTTDNAMLQDYTLAQLKEARLVARISEDENVLPSPGKLQGELVVPVIAGKTSQQSIIINKEIK